MLRSPLFNRTLLLNSVHTLLHHKHRPLPCSLPWAIILYTHSGSVLETKSLGILLLRNSVFCSVLARWGRKERPLCPGIKTICPGIQHFLPNGSSPPPPAHPPHNLFALTSSVLQTIVCISLRPLCRLIPPHPVSYPKGPI
jgi:hypothetical protein